MELAFPGYVFTRLDMDQESWLATAHSAPEIAYFLGCDGFPSALPDELIETIRSYADDAASSQHVISYKQVDPVAKRGPFTGIDAVFGSRLSGRGRVRMLLEIVQRIVPVAHDIHQLTKIGTSAPMLLVAG